MNEELKHKTISGFIYKFLERVGVAIVQLVVSIILARLLLPSQYGIIAVVVITITVLDVFVTYGFGNSLVVFKDSDQKDFSTCFFFGLALSLLIYTVFFIAAPYLSNWFSFDDSANSYKYDVELLTLVLRVMALRLPIASINTVQHAFVQKKMLFRIFFFSTLIGTIVSGAVAIVFAYLGFGVWALVIQYLGNIILDTFFLFVFTKWKPSFCFSFSKLKRIYSYGWKILLVGLIDTGYNELKSIIIARKYSSSDLAFYNKGNEFPSTFNNFIEPTISTVMLPTFSKVSDDKEQMKDFTKKAIRISSFIIFPIMVGLFCVSKPLIYLLLTEKWSDAVIFLQIGCIAYLFRPIQFINNTVIRASKKSGLLLTLDVIKKTIGILLLIVSIRFGVVCIALSFVVTNVLSTIINIFPNKKILGYGYFEQLMDIFPNLFTALMMGLLTYRLTEIDLPIFATLIVQVIVGAFSYFAVSIITKNESISFLTNYVKNFFKKMKR